MNFKCSFILLIIASFKLVNCAILDFDQWMDSSSSIDFLSRYYDMVHNLTRDAKRSPSYGQFSRYPPRPSYGYYYRPYYKPSTTTTEEPETDPPPECGAGPYHGGPPLQCMLRTECIAQGGQLGEPCGKGFSRGFCCEYPHTISCGETSDEVHLLFRNPDYPDTTSKPFSCVAGIIPRPETCGIRLEFLDSLMGQAVNGYCYQDNFIVLGGGSMEYNGFNTPFCGIIKGYATVIPVNQTSDLVQLVVNSQSRNVLWNINVTQVHCASLYLPFDDRCGVRNFRSGKQYIRRRSEENNTTLAKNSEGKILGGGVVISAPQAVTQFPWMAAIRYDGNLVCGGVLISRQFILTAAHCVAFYGEEPIIPVKRFRVLLGAYDLTIPRPTPTNTERYRLVRRIVRIYIHPEYHGNNFDLAILKMNETVIYNAAIRPVCIPEDWDDPYTRLPGLITGWGGIGGPTTSNPTLLGAANVPIVTNLQCSNAWDANNVFIRESMICAGDGTSGICQNDAGGPLLIQEEDGLYSLVGIASFGAPPACGNPNFPDVYSRVTHFVHWIALVLALPLPDHY